MVPVAKPVFWCKYYLLPFFVSTHVPQHWATSTGSCPFAIWDKTIVKSVSTVLTLRCWYLYVTSVACIAYPKYKLVLSFFCLFFFSFWNLLKFNLHMIADIWRSWFFPSHHHQHQNCISDAPTMIFSFYLPFSPFTVAVVLLMPLFFKIFFF